MEQKIIQITDDFGYWFSGFVDGEGCFNVSCINRKNFKNPQITTNFVIAQAEYSIMNEINNILQLGWYEKYKKPKIYKSISREFPGCYTYHLATRSLNDCLLLISIFDKYKLRTKKKRQYELWKEAVYIRQINNHKQWLIENIERIKQIIQEIRKIKCDVE